MNLNLMEPLLILRILLGLTLAGYTAYAALTVWAARKWAKARPNLDPAWTPAVTILKPVCGVDAEAWENFASFCRQDYPADRVQILFGALDRDDPALQLAYRLQNEFPHCDIGVFAAPPDAPRGANRKVSNLLALLPHAKHDLLVLCDSDMHVEPDYLRRVVAPFQADWQEQPGPAYTLLAQVHAPDRTNLPREQEALAPRQAGARAAGAGHLRGERPETEWERRRRETPATGSRPVGLVTCPYRGGRIHSVAAVLEALGIGADFIPSTLVSRALEGVAFALGSTIALPRAVLTRIGGFEALLDELADDFLLGNKTARAGYEVVLSDYVIEDVLGQERFWKMWMRRLRWARTLRVCRPAGYTGAFITYGMALALFFLVAMQFSPAGWIVFAAVLAVRVISTLVISLHYTGDRNLLRYLPLLPVSDLLGFTLYTLSFCGNHIVWRGERFRLLPGGKLVREE